MWVLTGYTQRGLGRERQCGVWADLLDLDDYIKRSCCKSLICNRIFSTCEITSHIQKEIMQEGIDR